MFKNKGGKVSMVVVEGRDGVGFWRYFEGRVHEFAGRLYVKCETMKKQDCPKYF